MALQTDLIENTAGAFSQPSYRTRRGLRRPGDQAALWVRITLAVVVTALLGSVAVSSKSRSSDSDRVPPTPERVPDER